jgi:hypothetical protein
MNIAVKVGDKIEFWGSGSPDGLSTVLEIRPYTGRYPEYYNCVLKLSAKRVDRGWMEKTHKQPEDKA